MFRNSQQHFRSRTTYYQSSHRSFIITKCRYKTPNLHSKNYYELLGVERTASQKEIRKAFLKLSKEYHPDSNASDKTLHEKFVKINEAFSILSKQSTRTTYDQTLNPTSRSYSSSPPRRPPSTSSPYDWTYTHFDQQKSYQRRSTTTNETDWGTPHFDKNFFDMLRRRMKQDRERAKESSYTRPPSFGMVNPYFAPFSIISFLIGFGVLIHALQWRMARFSDPNYAADPRSRSYHAYREWQRLSALKDAQSIPMRDSSVKRDEDK